MIVEMQEMLSSALSVRRWPVFTLARSVMLASMAFLVRLPMVVKSSVLVAVLASLKRKADGYLPLYTATPVGTDTSREP